MHRRTTALLLALIVANLTLTASAADWPMFRGPNGDGASSDTGYPVSWSAEQNVKWKAELPRPGNGSPIVSGGCVFLTCAEDEKGLQRSLYCFDRKDGSRRWVRTVAFDKVMPTHKTNPYCGSTPAADGKRVLAWHSSAGLYCYDFDGNELWSRDLGEFEHIWGYGSSPVLYKDRVILHCGPGKRVFVTALDLATGKTLWETEEPFEGDGSYNADKKYMGSWSTPVIAQVSGKDQAICTMPTRVAGYDVDTGEIVWWCDGIRGKRGDLAYSSPMIAGGICVAIGGYRGPGVGLKLGGAGNVTESHGLWRIEENPQNIGTGVFLDDYVYKANAGPGTLQCIQASTGKEMWTARAAGGNHWGSVVTADGLLYVTNQNGTTQVFKPNPEEFESVAENKLGESSNSTPALSDGEIFIRTFQHLYCIAK